MTDEAQLDLFHLTCRDCGGPGERCHERVASGDKWRWRWVPVVLCRECLTR